MRSALYPRRSSKQEGKEASLGKEGHNLSPQCVFPVWNMSFLSNDSFWLIGFSHGGFSQKGGNFPTWDPVSTGKASSSKRLTVDATPQKNNSKTLAKRVGPSNFTT